MSFPSTIKKLIQNHIIGSTLRRRDEFEFQPGHLEIIERPPAPWARRSALAICSLLTIAISWSIIGKLDIHASATGRLIVSSHSKVIQSMEAGEVVAINVQDGQNVKAGDVLIRLNPVGAKAEVNRLQKQLNFQLLEKARLVALLSDKPIDNFYIPDHMLNSDRQVTLTKQHLKSVWQEVSAQLENYTSEMAVNRANLNKGHIELQSLEKLSTNISFRLSAQRKLEANNLLPKISLMEQEKELIDVERALANRKADNEVLDAQYSSLVEQQATYLAKVKREYFEQLSQTEATLSLLEQDLIKANEKFRLQELKAPVDGVVQQLAIHTLGGVVQPAKPLMVIVPNSSPIEAEIMVLNKDIGFVQSGQYVEIKIDAYPYTRYGTIRGIVDHISKDSVEDKRFGLVFPARVKLKQNFIKIDDDKNLLQAGMSVTGEIRTGKRRIIDYLLSPIQQYQSEALRER